MAPLTLSGTSVNFDIRQELIRPAVKVLCSPPSHFSIDHFLSTGKSSGKYHHGMRISSQGKGTSISSRRSFCDYNIWRSWDDCLWFQESLENEYERAAREKKMRLAQGKGVKGFNGLYKKDLASSWESLPSGPNPDSIARDIHKYIPTLTRRGTLFRASQATIDQRQAELILFVEALFSDDMPTLIKEIRVSSIISDFFGFSKRDYDFTESQTSNTVPRNSLTNSVFSSYFSASNPSLPSSNAAPSHKTYKRSQRSITPRPLSLASSTEISEEPRYPCKPPRRSRSRPLSTSSDSSARSESSSDTSLRSSTDPSIADDVPIVFGHNPSNPGDQSHSILEALPEEREMLSKSPEPYRQAKPRPRASVMERKAYRAYSIFGLSLSLEKLGDHSARESWRTVDSLDSTANDLLDGLGLVLPHSIKEQKYRASVASVSTFMTTDSADAVIPETPRAQTTSQQPPFKSSIRISTPLSLSDFDVYSDTVENDSVLGPMSFIPEMPESRPQTPDLSLPPTPSSTRTTFNRAPSPTCSALSSAAFSTTTTSTSCPADSISIKAIHNTCIILLRVSRETRFAEVRQRLYNKFIGQEGVPLSQAYNLAFVPPNSALSADTCSTSVNVITSESDWEQLTLTLQGHKITVRILDVPTA